MPVFDAVSAAVPIGTWHHAELPHSLSRKIIVPPLLISPEKISTVHVTRQTDSFEPSTGSHPDHRPAALRIHPDLSNPETVLPLPYLTLHLPHLLYVLKLHDVASRATKGRSDVLCSVKG